MQVVINYYFMKKIHYIKVVSFVVLTLALFVSINGAVPVLAQSTTSSSVYGGTYCTGFSSSLISDSKDIGDVLKFFTCLIEVSIIPLIIALGVAMFVWGVVKFIGNEQAAEREQGKQFMVWGIVGLAVIFSVWGLVNLLGDTFHVRNVIPQLPVNPN